MTRNLNRTIRGEEYLRIFLTDKDIERGMPHRADACPVSFAVKRAWDRRHPEDKAESVTVTHRFSSVHLPRPGGTDRVTFRNPMAVERFVRAFDRGERPERLTERLDFATHVF